MKRDIWRTWRWREEPDAPLTWEHPERMVVIADGLMPPGAATDEHVKAWSAGGLAMRRGAIFLVVEHAGAPEMPRDCAPGLVPALRIERQADLDGDGLRALCAVQAQRRALVISPREAIEIRHGRAGRWSFPTRTDAAGHGIEWTEPGEAYVGVDLVVVQGPTGVDAWPMHPAWVRQIKAQCDDAGVAFALMSWGDWKPTGSVATWEKGGVRTYEEQGVAMLTDGRIILDDEPAETIRARDRATGHHVYSPAIERDRTAIECMHAEWRRAEKERRAPRSPYDEIAWFYRVGAERSGRQLWLRGPDGGLIGKPAEYLALPGGL